MKHTTDEQLENELAVFSNLKEVGAPDFFYTRLRAKMEKEWRTNELEFSIRPVLVICALTLFLFINSLLSGNDSNLVNENSNQNIEALAASYDQTISN